MDFRIKIECDPVQEFEHMGGFGTYCCFEFHKVVMGNRKYLGTIYCDSKKEGDGIIRALESLPDMIHAITAYNGLQSSKTTEEEVKDLMSSAYNKLSGA